MRYLFKLLLLDRRAFFFSGLSILALIFSTLAAQLEIAAFATIVEKGVDAFTLFEGEKKGIIERATIEKEWARIARGKSYITQKDAVRATSQRQSFVKHLLQWLADCLNLQQSLTSLLTVLTVIGVLNALTTFWRHYMLQLTVIRVTSFLKQHYFEHLQTLSLPFYQKYTTGALAVRAGEDAQTIADALHAVLMNYVQAPVVLLSSLVVLYHISPPLLLLVFAAIPFIAGAITFISRKVRCMTKDAQKQQEEFSSLLVDFLSGVSTIKAFALETFTSKKYSNYNQHVRRMQERQARFSLMVRPILHLVGTTILVTIILYGYYGLHLNLTEIVLFCGLLHMAYEPIKRFGDENTKVQKGDVAAERMEEVLSIRPEVPDTGTQCVLRPFQNAITFENVDFHYEEHAVLKALSFSIQRGEFVALVGPTGSGKSTITKLLLRLYDPTRGRITLDGVDIRTYTQDSLRRTMSVVPQKPFFFVDTIANNLALDRPMQMAQIVHAAKQAGAHDFITALPDGYQTLLSEAGNNFSGGQQQRLAIARALLRDTALLILDEATASLDSIVEHHVQQALENLRHKMTMFVIAHRLSTIEQADSILVLDQGRIIGAGSLHHVRQHCPLFQKMWAHQLGEQHDS